MDFFSESNRTRTESSPLKASRFLSRSDARQSLGGINVGPFDVACRPRSPVTFFPFFFDNGALLWFAACSTKKLLKDSTAKSRSSRPESLSSRLSSGVPRPAGRLLFLFFACGARLRLTPSAQFESLGSRIRSLGDAIRPAIPLIFEPLEGGDGTDGGDGGGGGAYLISTPSLALWASQLCSADISFSNSRCHCCHPAAVSTSGVSDAEASPTTSDAIPLARDSKDGTSSIPLAM